MLVFWDVTAVMAVTANTPSAPIVLMSAWIPAPAPESDPAMVSATGGWLLIPRSCRQRDSMPRHATGGGSFRQNEPGVRRSLHHVGRLPFPVSYTHLTLP